MSITLYTTSWNGFWKKYKNTFEDNVTRLRTKPDEIIIVSDEPIDTYFKNIVANKKGPYPFPHFRNVAINNCKTDWIVSTDLDDLMFPNYLCDINYNVDVHAFSFLQNREYINVSKNKQLWNEYFESDKSRFIIPSSTAIRTNILKEARGYDSYGFEDRLMYCKIKALGGSVYFDPSIRYQYNMEENKYPKNKFVETESAYKKIKKLSYKPKIPRVIFCFWFGNEMSVNRKKCLDIMIKHVGVEIILITEHNLNEWEIQNYPIHSHFKYLSATQKSDYLRSYFMYHYGGGYSDIKQCYYDWNMYFEMLNDSYCDVIGYAEKSSRDIAYPLHKNLYNKMIGCGQFIFKPKSEYAEEWHTEVNEILNKFSNELEKNPATDNYPQAVRGTIIENNGRIYNDYPFEWAKFSGTYHKVQPKYFHKILNMLPYVNMEDYR